MDTAKTDRVFLPAGGGIFFALLFAMFLFREPLQLLWDGGTCRHIVNGLYIFDHHYIPSTNYLWAINPNQPWVTHELLADILFGAADSLFGLNGVVLLCSLAISLSLTWTYQMARARGLSMLVGMVLTVAIMYAASIHWSARPHVLTYLPFLAMYWLIFCAPPSRHQPWIIAGITAIWANLHGSFTLGLVMLGCKLLVRFPSEYKTGAWKADATNLAAALVASCLNIRGVGLLLYVFTYVTHPTIAGRSGEWRPLELGLGPQVWTFLFLAALFAGVSLLSRKKAALPEALYVAFLFASSCNAMRIIPYFVMAGMIMSAPSFAALPQWKFDTGLGAKEPQNKSIAVFWSAVAALLAAIWLSLPTFKISDFDPAKQPVVCTNYLKQHEVEGVGFNWDNYGDYLYWKLGKPIYIDDKTDFYPRDFVEEYARLYFTNQGWEEVLKKNEFAWILIPHSIPLAEYLKRDPKWKLQCQDGSSALFVRAASSANGS